MVLSQEKVCRSNQWKKRFLDALMILKVKSKDDRID